MGPNFQNLILAFILSAHACWASEQPSVQRFTRQSLESEIRETVLSGQADDRQRFETVLISYERSLERFLPSWALEKLLMEMLESQVIDFYTLDFSILDRQEGKEAFRLKCQSVDYQSQRYLVIENCETQQLTSVTGPSALQRLSAERFHWMILYEELRFQREARR